MNDIQDETMLARAFETVIDTVDPEPMREGVLQTPRRAARAMRFMTSGYSIDPKSYLTTFIQEGYDCDEMVLIKDIPLYSLCEHHLLPFFGVAHVAYIPDKAVLGLSKIPRVVNAFALRLQVQERLTDQIATLLHNELQCLGVAVTLECRHLCMEARGICKQGHTTITSSMKGVFMSDPSTRQEYLRLIR